MKLEKKKNFAARALMIGKRRISFNPERLEDIKSAITKQDIRDLVADHAIIIKDVNGRKIIKKRKGRRRAGSIRMKVKSGKRDYINLTRNLRGHLLALRRKGEISEEAYSNLRKEIRAKSFKDKVHFKERILQFKK